MAPRVDKKRIFAWLRLDPKYSTVTPDAKRREKRQVDPPYRQAAPFHQPADESNSAEEERDDWLPNNAQVHAAMLAAGLLNNS